MKKRKQNFRLTNVIAAKYCNADKHNSTYKNSSLTSNALEKGNCLSYFFDDLSF